MDVGGLNYRKEIWKLLKEYENSKTMTLQEVLDKIMAVPREVKNPYKKGGHGKLRW